jgi:hypothetical protein
MPKMKIFTHASEQATVRSFVVMFTFVAVECAGALLFHLPELVDRRKSVEWMTIFPVLVMAFGGFSGIGKDTEEEVKGPIPIRDVFIYSLVAAAIRVLMILVGYWDHLT